MNNCHPFVNVRICAFCIFAGLCLIVVQEVAATDQLTAGTNARKIRQQAVQTIPMQQLVPEARAKIQPIIENPSIYRRLPVTAIDVDPDYFLYLTRYPEVIVNIWQLMGVTTMNVDRTGPFTLKTMDGAGMASDVELVYGTNNMSIYLAKGSYAGPLLKRQLKGSCVLVLQTNYRKGPNGKNQAVSSLDVFLKVDNVTVGLIAKTLNPLVGSTADHNFVESLNFVQRLNETTEKNGFGVQRMADRLTQLTPEVRKGFVNSAGVVFQRAQAKEAAASKTRDSNVGFSQPGTRAYQRTSEPTSSVRPGQFNTNSNVRPASNINRAGLRQFEQLNRASRPGTRITDQNNGVAPAIHYRGHRSNVLTFDRNVYQQSYQRGAMPNQSYHYRAQPIPTHRIPILQYQDRR